MKINVQGLTGIYDNRFLTQCKCGEHWYPSKRMFAEFLKQYEDIDADVDIWAREDWDTGEVKITVELKYLISDARSSLGKAINDG